MARGRAPAADSKLAKSEGLSPIRPWIFVGLVAAVMIAYLPALRGPFVMDDTDTISASAAWKTVPGSPTSGRPVVLATLAANSALNRALGVDERPDPDGPYKAVSYRSFNVILHLLTGALLFGFLRRTIRERTIREDWRAVADPIAGMTATLWLLHPIQSEVINYIVQRSEGLASFFYLATLYASQRAWPSAAASRLRWYALAVVTCALGMMSKEIGISAPLAVMLYDRAFRLPSWRALLRPGNGRGWLYVALWAAALAAFGTFEAGARGDTAGFGVPVRWYEYLYTSCWAIAHYLRLAVWPSPLAIDYGVRMIGGARGVPGALLLAVLAIATIVAWSKVPRYGWFAFLGSCFFMLLAPSSSVVPIASEIAAERRIYLALAAVLVLVVVSAEGLRRRVAKRLSIGQLATVVAGVAIALMLATAARSYAFASNEALWRSAVRAIPENPRALSNLGWALYKSSAPKLAEADSIFDRATLLDPTCEFACRQYASVLNEEGRLPDAEAMLDRSLTAARGSGVVLTERALGLVLMKMNQYAKAVPHLERAVERMPTTDHLEVLAVAYLFAGRRDEAIATFRRVGSLNGGSRDLQRLSSTLIDAAIHPEALPALRDFALRQSRNWM